MASRSNRLAAVLPRASACCLVASLLLPGIGAARADNGPGTDEVRWARRDGTIVVSRGQLELVFSPAGRGLVASARIGSTEACRESRRGGMFLTAVAPKGKPKPLEPLVGQEIEASVTVDTVDGRDAEGRAIVEIRGKLTLGALGAAPFFTRIEVPAKGPAMAVSAEVKIPREAAEAWLTSFGLAVPLALDFHPTSKGEPAFDAAKSAMVILPRVGTPIPEVRRLVARQDNTSVWGQMLWTQAGVRQIGPKACEVWEAWGPQNPPFVLQYNSVHPGWMAVADGKVAVAAGMPGAAERLVKADDGSGIERIGLSEIYVDAEAKVLRICFQSPHCRPVRLESEEKIKAGPAYVFIERAEANTRNAGDYGDEKKRPALAGIGEQSRKLLPTKFDFGESQDGEDNDEPESDAGDKAKKHAEDEPDENCVDPDSRDEEKSRLLRLAPLEAEFASHEPYPRDRIPIWIDELNGATCTFPVTRGVPLGRGVLADEKKVALLDAGGNGVPCVARAVAYWPDRSIKWLLLDFQASLRAELRTRFTLVVGDKARPMAFWNPLKIKEAGDSVELDTGRLRAVLTKKNGELLASFALDQDADRKFSQEEVIVPTSPVGIDCLFSHIKDPGAYRSHTWVDPGEPDPGEAEITELRVEQQSPLRAVVLVRAMLKHKLLASTIPEKNRPPAGTPITLRLHFYAGSALVRIQHTFMFAGDVNHDFLKDLSLAIPVPSAPHQSVGWALDAGCGSMGSSDSRGPHGVLQESPDSVFLWSGPGRSTWSSHASGWLYVADRSWSAYFALPRMRQMFPQEISVDDKYVRFHFYSPRVPPMDLRRYAFKYGDGESSSTGWGTALGSMRTNEAYLYFPGRHQRELFEPPEVTAALQPPLARIPPRYVADTLAVGHVAEHAAPTNDPHFDAVLLHMPRMHQHNREFWRWFGFWDFGDEMQVYDARRQRWARDEGRYAWYNNEPIRDYDYHLAYLMTANPRIWEQAEAMTYHVLEVDVRHANPQPFLSPSGKLAEQKYSHSTTSGIDLSGPRHNCQHWSDGYFGPRVGSPAGFRLCYYQNGDPVLREHLERLLASALKVPRSQYMSADGDEAILWAMLMGYEMTLDQKYLERIKGYARLQTEFAPRHNNFPAAQANFDWATARPGAPAQDPRGDLWIWSFGGHAAMIEIADMLGDRALDRMLQDWTLALEGFGPDKKRRGEWSNEIGASPLLAHYYRATGDRRALEWFRERARHNHFGIPECAPREDLLQSVMSETLPAYTPNDGYGWVYPTSSFWYLGIPAWQGALRERGGEGRPKVTGSAEGKR